MVNDIICIYLSIYIYILICFLNIILIYYGVEKYLLQYYLAAKTKLLVGGMATQGPLRDKKLR